MPEERIVSVDIGSTYTKGALFTHDQASLRLRVQAVLPTTVEQLDSGFCQILEQLGFKEGDSLFASSSAKGGLNMVALGIVPELTLKMARMAALSAGARVSASFSYKLTRDDLGRIEELHPDIILFTGGTEGGNEESNRHNASMLARLTIRPDIIYAGNRNVVEIVEQSLRSFPVHVVNNVLPHLDKPSPEAARQAIRDIFLRQIIRGKGLEKVAELCSGDPAPTPLSVLRFMEALPRYAPDWEDSCLVDLGGATTDFYTVTGPEAREASVIYRGLPEPSIKRSVEADLGLRVSARSAMEASRTLWQKELNEQQCREFEAYVQKIALHIDYLPGDESEKKWDRLLAMSAVKQAAHRHAGRRRRVFTAQGEAFIHRGKDLRTLKRMIGTGGFLSRLKGFDPGELLQGLQGHALADEIPMLPDTLDYYRDDKYLLPLLGNLVGVLPQEAVLPQDAVHLGLSALTHEGPCMPDECPGQNGRRGGRNWN